MAMFHLEVVSLFTYIFSKQDLHRCPPSYTKKPPKQPHSELLSLKV